MFDFLFKHKRRAKLRAKPLSARQRAAVRRNVPYVATLSEEDQRELEGHIQVFLAEKRFEGCGGLAMTNEIKVTVAAQACVLLLHRETDYYPGLGSILVYPSAYVVRNIRRQLGSLVVESDQVRLGESSVRGAVVLAWDAELYEVLRAFYRQDPAGNPAAEPPAAAREREARQASIPDVIA